MSVTVTMNDPYDKYNSTRYGNVPYGIFSKDCALQSILFLRCPIDIGIQIVNVVVVILKA
jgi:hypothetical protein